jgi:MFS family permease
MPAGDSIDRSSDAGLRRATLAVYAVFVGSGFTFSSWASRIPQVRDGLHLSPASLGLLLLSIAAGSVVSLPLAGLVVARLGAARTIVATAFMAAAGLAIAAIGYRIGVAPVVAGLFLLGAGNGTWDVAMNVEGADVERRLGRTVMPRFHAGFSLGTVAGAGLSAVFAALGVSLAAQLYLTAAVTAATMIVMVRRFLPHPVVPAGERRSANVLRAWRAPRILLIGLIMLGFGFTEGTANDWLAISLVDGYRASETVGAIGFGAFVTAMTLTRLFGGNAIERWGRVTVLRLTAAAAAIGLLLVAVDVAVPVALVGAVLWGAGASLGFPIGMSSAADDPLRAAINVSVAGAIGYGAFLAGPPLIGLLAEHLGVLRAILCVFGALAIGVAASGAARPPERPGAAAADGK